MKRFYTYILYIATTAALLFSSCVSSDGLFSEGEILQLSTESISAEANGASVHLEITTNFPYTVSSDSDWITWDSHRSVVCIDSNPTIKERVGNVIVTIKDPKFDVEYSKSVQVAQKRGDVQAYAYLSGFNGAEEASEITIDAKPAYGYLCIHANSDWHLSFDDKWVNIYTTSGKGSDDLQKLGISIDQNDSLNSRTTVITLVVYEGLFSSYVTYPVTITQSGIKAEWACTGETITNKTIIAPSTSSKHKITILGNLSWEAKVENLHSWQEEGWITLSKTSGKLNKYGNATTSEIEVTIAENPNNWSRQAYLTIYSTEYGNPDNPPFNQFTTCLLIEQASAPESSVSESNISAKYLAGDYSVNFSIGGNWVATSSADWLTIANPSGTANDREIAFSVAKNDSSTMREATITIALDGYETLNRTITVTQDHKNTLYYTRRSYSSALSFSSDHFDCGITEHTYKLISENPSTYEGRVVFDGNLRLIGASAFKNSSITNIIIPESVTTIGDDAFGYTNLISCTLPDSITNIGNWAFSNCTYLESITLPSNLNTLGNYAFYSCSALKEITIPQGITRIENCTFNRCTSLVTVELPSTTNSIGASAFEGCEALTYVNGGNITAVGDRAFYDCRNLRGTISGNITYLDDNAFFNCSSLEEISINTDTISGDAFYNCSSLRKVVLGTDITRFEYYAFYGCSAVEEVHFSGTAAQWNAINFDNIESNPVYTGKAKLYVGGYLLTSLRTSSENISGISSYAFRGCSSLTTVELNKNRSAVNSRAFEGCPNITSVTLGSESTIWDNAFAHCPKLTSISQRKSSSDSPAFISDKAFYGCSALKTADLYKVYYIGESAFEGCSAFTKCTMSGSCNNSGTIDNRAFYGCSNLTTVTLTDCYNMGIGEYAFYNCKKLTNISFESGTHKIGKYAFYGCSSLTSVNLHTSTNCTIEPYAFYNCSGLTNVELSGYVTLVGSFSFSGCSALADVNIKTYSSANTVIDTNAFGSGLQNITLGNGVKSINSNAFLYCSAGLKSVNCLSTTPPTGASGMFPSANNTSYDYKIYVPTSAVDTYKSAEYWSNYSSRIVGKEF